MRNSPSASCGASALPCLLSGCRRFAVAPKSCAWVVLMLHYQISYASGPGVRSRRMKRLLAKRGFVTKKASPVGCRRTGRGGGGTGGVTDGGTP